MELAQELISIRHGCTLLEIQFSETAAEFAATNEYDRLGSVTPIDWIRHNCQMSGHDAAARVCVGEELHRLPQSAAATADGEIGFGHLSLMARTSRALSGSESGDGFDESLLLSKAAETSVGAFWHICQHARHANDPEGFAIDERHAVEARELHLRSCDGFLKISGLLDAAGGAVLRTALEPLAGKSGVADDRRRDRRMADALVELATHALDAGLVPQRASQRTHLQITASLETLMGMRGAPPRSWSSRRRSPHGWWSGSRVIRRSLGSCWAPTRPSLTSAGRNGWCPGPPGGRSMFATSSASGLAASGTRPGLRPTIWFTGATAGGPTSPTSSSCAIATTGWSTRVGGSWSVPPTAQHS